VFLVLWFKDKILIVSGLVDLVANMFNKLSKGLLVIMSASSPCLFKIDFSQVHSNRVWREVLEELHHEIDTNSLRLSVLLLGRLKLNWIKRAGIEGDPVLKRLSLWLEVSTHESVNFHQVFRFALLSAKNKLFLGWYVNISLSKDCDISVFQTRHLTVTFWNWSSRKLG